MTAGLLLMCLSFGRSPRAADAGTLVNFNTQLGTIQIDLFDDLVPETVANFLSYTNSNAYANTVVHRSTSIADTGLAVIQGGGYNYNALSGLFEHITTSDPVVLQYNRANSAGTIAMARTQALNSATSEWFINTVDNTDVLGESNGGGYAVFGWIVGNGLSIAQTINNLPKSGFGGIPTNVPLQNYTPPGAIEESNLVFVNSISVDRTHPSFQNPFNSSDVVNDGILRASDVHAVINDLLANGLHNVAGPFSGTNYVDANGNGAVTAADVHHVINALLLQNAAAQAAPMTVPLAAPTFAADTFAAPKFTVVPEPTSLLLAAAAAFTLAAGAFWRRRRLAAARANR